MVKGLVEVVSRHFVSGWAAIEPSAPNLVIAELDGTMLGYAEASIERPDLEKLNGSFKAFLILFHREVLDDELPRLRVLSGYPGVPLRHGGQVRIETGPVRQIFIVGSPRSGTSELGSTLSGNLALPWFGEGHVAPLFAVAADALSREATAPNGLTRFIERQHFSDEISKLARVTYYFCHRSASFIDKTPGTPMITAVPLLVACFPNPYFIFLYRNGISNVLSRLTKFGGSVPTHCRDWAGAMTAWEAVRGAPAHYLELSQEEMLHSPECAADRIAAYLGVPENADAIATSLKAGKRERTGAGLGKTALTDTGWSDQDIAAFRQICGSVMERWGYATE